MGMYKIYYQDETGKWYLNLKGGALFTRMGGQEFGTQKEAEQTIDLLRLAIKPRIPKNIKAGLKVECLAVLNDQYMKQASASDSVFCEEQNPMNDSREEIVRSKMSARLNREAKRKLKKKIRSYKKSHPNAAESILQGVNTAEDAAAMLYRNGFMTEDFLPPNHIIKPIVKAKEEKEDPARIPEPDAAGCAGKEKKQAEEVKTVCPADQSAAGLDTAAIREKVISAFGPNKSGQTDADPESMPYKGTVHASSVRNGQREILHQNETWQDDVIEQIHGFIQLNKDLPRILETAKKEVAEGDRETAAILDEIECFPVAEQNAEMLARKLKAIRLKRRRAKDRYTVVSAFIEGLKTPYTDKARFSDTKDAIDAIRTREYHPRVM